MAKKILVDTGFWYALYDNMDEQISIHSLLTFNCKDFMDICCKRKIEVGVYGFAGMKK